MKKRIIAAAICSCLLITGVLTIYASANGYLRSINLRNVDTLNKSEKWTQVPDEKPEWSELNDPDATLQEHLKTVLDDDLTDTSDCEQVWEFSSDEFEEVKEWCLDNPKGTETNKKFLEKYKENNCVYEKEEIILKE